MPEATAMTPDLMSVIYKQITPETIRAIASQLGEDGERTASAVSAGVPSVLTALSDVARSDTGAGHLKEIIDEKRSRNPSRMEGATALLSATGGGGHDHDVSLLDDELGQRAWTISDAVAKSSGIRPESAHKLLGGVTSVAVLAVAKSAGNLSTRALRAMLSAQRGEWLKRMPKSMATTFETPAIVHQVISPQVIAPESKATRVTGTAIRELERPKRSWLLPVLLVAAAILFFPLLRGMRHRPAPTPEQTHTAAVTEPRATPVPAARPTTPTELRAAQPVAPPAAGLALPGAPIGAMAAFLASSEGMTPRRFALPPLGYDTGAVEPSIEAGPVLKQVATLLQAHPSAAIRVESFTDNIGSPDQNLDLSRRRSEAVKALLVDGGADASRIEVSGLGQQHPIASNDSEDGRRQNRRTDLIVTQR